MRHGDGFFKQPEDVGDPVVAGAVVKRDYFVVGLETADPLVFGQPPRDGIEFLERCDGIEFHAADIDRDGIDLTEEVFVAGVNVDWREIAKKLGDNPLGSVFAADARK